MAKARSEAQSILAEGKTAAEKVKDDIIAKSKEQANKIREDAGNQIQVEKDKAISEIKEEVVNLTLSVAEKLIQKNLSDADNKSLIEASLKKVKPYEA
jgi:F-type H+-transporting ATPase subunit b